MYVFTSIKTGRRGLEKVQENLCEVNSESMWIRMYLLFQYAYLLTKEELGLDFLLLLHQISSPE